MYGIARESEKLLVLFRVQVYDGESRITDYGPLVVAALGAHVAVGLGHTTLLLIQSVHSLMTLETQNVLGSVIPRVTKALNFEVSAIDVFSSDPLHHQSSLRITKTPFPVIPGWGTTFSLKIPRLPKKTLRHYIPNCLSRVLSKRFF